ncbi:MAG TPA: gluconate 2-dehydrogenase subunit 3 family protein [Bryobacteraceae bacterium]|jgi:hypothetical protein
MNRRDWMIAAIASVSLPGTEPGEAALLFTETPHLPPGVYLPSTDHLGHALAQVEQPPSGPFHPQSFSPAEFTVIRRIAELILGEEPHTAVSEDAARWIDLRVSHSGAVRDAALRLDPLHHAVAVGYYGQASVQQLESYEPKRICSEGLAWLAQKGDFVSATTDQQIAILDSISDARTNKQEENAGTRFFTFMKSEVIRGFYTSRTGLKELDFKGNGFYASSPGCKQAPK